MKDKNREALDEFKQDLRNLNIILREEQLQSFLEYYDLLVEWNEKMNLTAITEFQDVLKKHFTDSLTLIKAIPDLEEKEYKLIDVGTGAGFPGIPLKIAFPGIHATLLDSLNKRIGFLNHVIQKANLEKIEAIHGRAEDLAKPQEKREKYDICVSRAVANLATLSEYCIPFVKIGGTFISYKADLTEDELEGAKKAIKTLGGKIKDVISFQLPETEMKRTLVVIEKISSTPKKYPRKAGIPAKEPIM